MTHQRTLPMLLEKRGPICEWCHCKLLPQPRPQPKGYAQQHHHATVDHILPKSRGGKSSIVYYTEREGDLCNVKLSCYRCNNLREVANGCIGALHCAYAVVGSTTHKQKICTWLNKLPKADRFAL